MLADFSCILLTELDVLILREQVEARVELAGRLRPYQRH
jgi:hypothetical protein